MRYIYGTLLIVFLSLIIIFSVQNLGPARILFLTWTIEMPQAVLIVASYLLGMLSGWSVLSFVRQSYKRVRVHDQ